MLKDLPTDKIHARDDARDINPANVEALVSSIADIGLINPIRVRANSDGWEVIAGRHRLEAHKSLGLIEIACLVVEEHAETAMIDENLVRMDLSPAERARYMSRRREIYHAAHPETKAGGYRDPDRPVMTESFAESVAKATGRSAQSALREAARGDKVIDEVLDMITGTPLDTGVYLEALAKLPPNDQFKAAQRDLATERDKSRQANAETQAANLAAKAKKKAVGRAAELIATYVPETELDALVAALMAAGKASDVAREIETLR